jgi:hypothetical protein
VKEIKKPVIAAKRGVQQDRSIMLRAALEVDLQWHSK